MSVLKYYDGTNWVEVNGQVTGDTLPIGAIMPFGGESVPTGWLLCRGQELSRSSYSELYSVIGDSFGGDDERETFYLPNLKGRVIVGQDTTQTEFDSIGETGGEKTHTLTIQEIPAHSHGLNQPGTSGSGTVQFSATISDVYSEIRTKDTGGGQAHNILQPYIVTNYIIKAKQVAGLVGSVTNNYSVSSTDTYSCEYINSKIEEIMNIINN